MLGVGSLQSSVYKSEDMIDSLVSYYLANWELTDLWHQQHDLT